MTTSVEFPQFLGHAVVIQDPLVAITFPVGSYLVASLTTHLSFHEDAFLWWFLVLASLLKDAIFHEGCIFCIIRLGVVF